MDKVITEVPTWLQLKREALNTQHDGFTKTPLFCVYERDSEDEEETGKGWPVSISLTEQAASAFMEATVHRLRHPYIYIQSPGEGSDIHQFVAWIRTAAFSIQEPKVKPAKQFAFAFNENDCGGVFDGNTVTSDADPGL